MRWRLCLVLGLVGSCLWTGLPAQPRNRPPPQYRTWGEPDQAKGLALLESFRASWMPGDYFLSFSLRTYGSGRSVDRIHGRIFGGRGPSGPASLIDIAERDGEPVFLRYLIQNGPDPTVWRLDGEGMEPRQLNGEELSEPLFGTDITPFDLQLPYLYWKDFIYEGVTRYRGRPTEVFILYPPADELDLYPAITGVRLYLDSQFNAMMQAAILDENLEVVKELNLLEIRKVEESWIAKTIDVRRPNGMKTRFRVEAASMDNLWNGRLLLPEGLSGRLPEVSEAELTRIN
ncbi:MAG: hypothetical protein R3F07_13400 [Opitutaceae bacterium]